jgi:hypothetical protein
MIRNNRSMADNQENQTTQPDVLQASDDGPHLEQAKDEPKVETEAWKRAKERNSPWPKRIDSSIWIAAAISAIAALAGVLIGTFMSYHTAQSQANARAGASKSSATAKANADLINKRQRDYADYFKNEGSLANTGASLATVLRSNPDDLGALNSAKDKWNRDSAAAARSDLILSFNGSDKVDSIREEIHHQTDTIRKALASLLDQAYAHQPIDQPGIQGIDAMFAALQSQFDRFTDQAKADLRSPNGGLPPRAKRCPGS